MKSSEPSVHVEPHIKESNYIRDVVFGFGDGVNTSFGGAIIAPDIVILAALIGMFTGAKAIACTNYLAVKSQRQILESEIRQERFEIENIQERRDRKLNRYTNRKDLKE